jgi:hypothetical protein
MESVTTPDSDDDSDATGPPEETPERETESRQEADETELTRQEADRADLTRQEEKPEQPETPEHGAHADETATQAAQDVDAFKPDDGCATPPPPPAHDSEVSDDNRSSPHREKPKPPAGASDKRPDVAAAKSMLLAFRSFSRDKKGKRSGDAGAPSPGEHRPADGKTWEEAAAEHKDKGKARWKSLWK